jgi:hypothetical protein
MNDGADVGLDLTGGWYDAGDHVKFGHPMTYSAAQLAWAVYEYRGAFEQSGQLDIILDEIKWALDYFIKSHPEPNVFYYDCGYGESDHSVWVPPEVVHMFTERASFKIDTTTPGSDVAGMASAAFTLGSLIFQPTDPAYSAVLMQHAVELFTFADTYRGINPLDNFYKSGGYLDDLTWAAIWLYIATGEQTYLDKALSYMPIETLGGHHTHCWDDVSYGAAMKIAQVTKDPAYIAMVESNLARALAVATAKDTNLLLMSFTRPICIILIILVVLSLLTPYLSSRAAGKRAKELKLARADVGETMETE